MLPTHNQGFVKVSHDRTHLILDGKPWFFCGANCYYLMTRAADPSTVKDVTSVLDDLQAAGITVIRTWAFNDGSSQWNALQTHPGVYDERVFRALDRVIVEASRRGMRLLLCLTNYWKDYGGMAQYCRWSKEQRSRAAAPHLEKASVSTTVTSNESSASAAPAACDFYEDLWCQQCFGAFIAAVVTRKNSISGIPYNEDPTIIGFAPVNEPQCPADPEARRGVLSQWAHTTATTIKRLAPRQLVFMDMEGYFGPSTPSYLRYNPPHSAVGVDFAQDCSSPSIDVACCHLYPDLWLPEQTAIDRKSWPSIQGGEGSLGKSRQELRYKKFAVEWIDSHVQICRKLGKPLVLSEFGKKKAKTASEKAGTYKDMAADRSRLEYFELVLDRCLHHMKEGNLLSGSIMWMAAAKTYADYDGFTIYFSTLREKAALQERQHSTSQEMPTHPPDPQQSETHPSRQRTQPSSLLWRSARGATKAVVDATKSAFTFSHNIYQDLTTAPPAFAPSTITRTITASPGSEGKGMAMLAMLFSQHAEDVKALVERPPKMRRRTIERHFNPSFVHDKERSIQAETS